MHAGILNAGGYEWISKCREVLNKILKALGQDRSVFYDPVNPQILPDYYRVVTHPIFLKDIEGKLLRRQYTSPQDFANDVRQHWANVKLYNPVGDPFRKIGEKASACGLISVPSWGACACGLTTHGRHDLLHGALCWPAGGGAV